MNKIEILKVLKNRGVSIETSRKVLAEIMEHEERKLTEAEFEADWQESHEGDLGEPDMELCDCGNGYRLQHEESC